MVHADLATLMGWVQGSPTLLREVDKALSALEPGHKRDAFEGRGVDGPHYGEVRGTVVKAMLTSWGMDQWMCQELYDAGCPPSYLQQVALYLAKHPPRTGGGGQRRAAKAGEEKDSETGKGSETAKVEKSAAELQAETMVRFAVVERWLTAMFAVAPNPIGQELRLATKDAGTGQWVLPTTKKGRTGRTKDAKAEEAAAAAKASPVPPSTVGTAKGKRKSCGESLKELWLSELKAEKKHRGGGGDGGSAHGSGSTAAGGHGSGVVDDAKSRAAAPSTEDDLTRFLENKVAALAAKSDSASKKRLVQAKQQLAAHLEEMKKAVTTTK